MDGCHLLFSPLYEFAKGFKWPDNLLACSFAQPSSGTSSPTLAPTGGLWQAFTTWQCQGRKDWRLTRQGGISPLPSPSPSEKWRVFVQISNLVVFKYRTCPHSFSLSFILNGNKAIKDFADHMWHLAQTWELYLRCHILWRWWITQAASSLFWHGCYIWNECHK